MTLRGQTGWWVGLFVLGAAAGGGGFLATRATQEYWIDRPWRISLTVEHGYDLVPGSLVKLNGVAIGWVDGVDLDPDGRVSATLAVKRRYHRFLTDRSRFTIRKPLVLGDSWVEVMTGPGGRPLAPGETAVATPPPETMEDLGITRERVTESLDTFQRLLADAAAIVADVRAGRGNLGRFVNDTTLYDAVDTALDQANAIMTQARRPDTSVGKLLTEDTLYAEVTALTKELRDTLVSLRSEEEEAKTAVRRLNTLLADADKAVLQIEEIARNMNAGKGTLGKFAQDETVYAEAQRILVQLRQTLEDLREQTPISTFVGALFSAF